MSAAAGFPQEALAGATHKLYHAAAPIRVRASRVADAALQHRVRRLQWRAARDIEKVEHVVHVQVREEPAPERGLLSLVWGQVLQNMRAELRPQLQGAVAVRALALLLQRRTIDARARHESFIARFPVHEHRLANFLGGVSVVQRGISHAVLPRHQPHGWHSLSRL